MTSDERGAILPCGAFEDDLLEQVADGPDDPPTAHQADCRHCQAALGALRGLWAPVEAARALPVEPPDGLVASIKADIRRRVASDASSRSI